MLAACEKFLDFFERSRSFDAYISTCRRTRLLSGCFIRPRPRPRERESEQKRNAMKTKLMWVATWGELARAAGYSARKLTRMCGISRSALGRHFNRAHNQSPQKWLDEQRLLVALEELLAGKAVKVAALDAGFKQSSHFCRKFKERFHVTPLEFVAAHRRETQVVTADNK